MRKKFIFSEELNTEEAGKGIKRMIMGFDDNLMMVRVDFEKNAVGALHSHVHSQATYVLKGLFEITIDGETKTLNKDDSFFVAPDLIHGAVCLEEGTLIDVFNPARKDFLTAG